MPVLDGVRAIAVLIVIAFHFWQSFSVGQNGIVGKMAVWGQTGVDLFFVLSGFLITGILIDSKGSTGFLRNFYARRILRIFPLYYATLAVFYFVPPLLGNAASVPWTKTIWYWLYLQNIADTLQFASAVGPGHFWSLAVEEHFYLFWPLLVMRLSTKHLFSCIGAGVFISIATRVLLEGHGFSSFYFTLARLDGLGIGGAIAIYIRACGGLTAIAPLVRKVFLSLAVLLVAAQQIVGGAGLVSIQIVKGTLIALVYACLIILLLERNFGSTVDRMLCGTTIGSIGKYSYGMYVLHPFVLSGMKRMSMNYTVTSLAFAIAITYLAAWISWQCLEKHFLRLKRFFQYSGDQQSA